MNIKILFQTIYFVIISDIILKFIILVNYFFKNNNLILLKFIIKIKMD